jgi:hypothetical protein
MTTSSPFPFTLKEPYMHCALPAALALRHTYVCMHAQPAAAASASALNNQAASRQPGSTVYSSACTTGGHVWLCIQTHAQLCSTGNGARTHTTTVRWQGGLLASYFARYAPVCNMPRSISYVLYVLVRMLNAVSQSYPDVCVL